MGKLSDRNKKYGAPSIDDITGAQNMVDYVHHEIHDETHYEVSHIFGGVTLSATAEFLMTPPATSTSGEAHTLFQVVSDIAGKVELFADVTVAANGTSIASTNNYLKSVNTCGCTFFHTPTSATSTTDPIFIDFIGTAQGGGILPSSGGNSERNREWILEAGNKYLLRFTNWGTSATVGVVTSYYMQIPLV